MTGGSPAPPLEVRWVPRLPAALRALLPEERRPLVEAILALGSDPRPLGAVSHSAKPNWLRLDVGSFTILYVIDLVESTVTVFQVVKGNEPLMPDT